MKSFPIESKYLTADCAQDVLDVVPLVMQVVRAEMRRHRSGLSVPQFRTLSFVRRNPGVSLSAVARHVGLALPSMSKLVDSLVERKLVSRSSGTRDRRRVSLQLTDRGTALLEAARQATQAGLAERLHKLSAQERRQVGSALRMLQAIFHPVGPRRS
jgi:DNA-binding MarR family transcriptional regulator